MMPEFLGKLFDGNDRSREAHVALSALGFFALCVFQGYALAHDQGFDPSLFGQAVALIMGGGGAAAIGQGFLSGGRSIFARRTMPAPTHETAQKPDNPDA